MKTKIFLGQTRIVKISLTRNNKVIVELFDYASGKGKYSVDFRYYDYDYEMVLDIYKHFDLI